LFRKKLFERGKIMHFSQRELRGLGMVAAGGQIKRLSDGNFLVKSQSHVDDSYHVGWSDGKWRCDCPDYKERRTPCKHIYAVNFLLDLPSIILSNAGTILGVCPYCGSEETTMKGLRYNKTGAVRLRLCKNCNRRFKEELIAESKGVNATLELIAFDLHCKGVSLRDIKNHIWQIYCIDKPVSTLHRWILKLVEVMKKASSDFKMEVGDKWLADETLVKVKGREHYLWNIIDYETRCHIASVLTEGRGSEEALRVIKEAVQQAGKEPQKLITDGLQSYAKALKALENSQITHVSNVGLKSHEDNNRIERLHGTIKSWIKPQRGLKDRVQENIETHRLYYNMIRPNIALSEKTPIKSCEDGRWLSLALGKSRCR
jgi:transposase-like protein